MTLTLVTRSHERHSASPASVKLASTKDTQHRSRSPPQHTSPPPSSILQHLPVTSTPHALTTTPYITNISSIPQHFSVTLRHLQLPLPSLRPRLSQSVLSGLLDSRSVPHVAPPGFRCLMAGVRVWGGAEGLRDGHRERSEKGEHVSR